MPITHAYVSGKADPGDATLIKASDWNNNHDYPAFTILSHGFGDDPYAVRTPPAGITETYGVMFRYRADLTRIDSARVVGNPSSNFSAVAVKLAVQYSLDQVSWFYLDNVSGPSITLTPVGIKVGAWVNLVAGAKADVWLRWITVSGNGVATLQWMPHYMQGR